MPSAGLKTGWRRRYDARPMRAIDPARSLLQYDAQLRGQSNTLIWGIHAPEPLAPEP